MKAQMDIFVICLGSNKEQTEVPITIRLDRETAVLEARALAAAMIAAGGVHEASTTDEEISEVGHQHPVETSLESTEILRIHFYDKGDDPGDGAPHGYLAVYEVDDTEPLLAYEADLVERVDPETDAEPRRFVLEIEHADEHRSVSLTAFGPSSMPVAEADVLLEFEDGQLNLYYWGHRDCECDPTKVVLLTPEETEAILKGD